MKILVQIASMSMLHLALSIPSQGAHQLNPCGTAFNYYITTNNQTLVVVDNDGKDVFKWKLPPQGHFLGCSEFGEGFYMRVLFSKKATQQISILNAEGRLQRQFEVEPLHDISVFESLDLLVAYGHPLMGDGRALSESYAVAYSLTKGDRVRGNLPESFGLHSAPVLAAGADSLWVAANFEDASGAVCLVQYDHKLRERLRKKIAEKGSTVHSVGVEGDYVYGVTSILGNRDARHSLFVYEQSKKKVETNDLDAFTGSAWVRSVAVKEIVVLWNDKICVGVDLDTKRERWRENISGRLSPDLIAVDESGYVVLREKGIPGNDKTKLFVVDYAKGNVFQTIEVDVDARGFVKRGSARQGQAAKIENSHSPGAEEQEQSR